MNYKEDFPMRDKIKSLIKQFFAAMHVDAFYKKRDYHYVPDYFGKSAHKQQDIRNIPVFGELAHKVIQDGRASLYYDRLFTIYQILSNWAVRKGAETETLNMVEVGVYKGGTSYFIALLAERLGLPISHFCFDTFRGHAVEDINVTLETSHRPLMFGDTSLESVRQYLFQFNNVNIYQGRIQDTAHILRDTSLHFVHLDMDIYEPTVFALHFFAERMVAGGVILLDDYGFVTCPGVEAAVREFNSSHTGYFGTALLSGQYILVKL
jgi:O-methyltransferase